MQWWVEYTLDAYNYKEYLRNTQKAFYVHGSTMLMHDEMVDFPKFGHIFVFEVPVAECLLPTPAMTHSIDNDKNITISFIVLFVISVVVTIVLIAVIIYCHVAWKKFSSYSPNV